MQATTINTRAPLRVHPRIQPGPGQRDYFQLPLLYALVIGINSYTSPEIRPLHRAVKDADDFCDYLTSKLHIPLANITNLRDQQATRAAILGAFVQLEDRSAGKGDIGIVIYFAGHGTRCEKPEDWEDWETVGKHVEAICPADMNTLSLYERKGEDESGREVAFQVEAKVPAIPDRTISNLLNRLSEATGNNITLILDCCHSAGANRAEDVGEPEKLGFVNRRVHDSPPIPPHYDDPVTGPSSRSWIIAKGFVGKNQNSHVLLAACGHQQTAYEHPDEPNGVFTHALLEVLKKYEAEDLTYISLIHAMEMPPWQNAHCGGAEVHRRLFNHKVKGADKTFILGTKDDQTSALTLKAGTAQGISAGSRFSVHGSNLLSLLEQLNPALCNLVVSSVEEYSSHLTFAPDSEPFDLNPLFYCKLTSLPLSSSLSVSSPDLVWLQKTITFDFCASHSVKITSDTHSADFIFTLEDGVIYIDHNLTMTAQHIDARSPFKVPEYRADLLQDIIRCAANFRFHLFRTNPDVPSINVSMELRELEPSEDGDSAMPVGDNILIEEIATITVDEDNPKWYGVMIDNQTDMPLYPHLFYFDLLEFSIRPWYLPQITTAPSPDTSTPQVNAILPGQSKLPVGYGESNAPPWSFWMREGESKDVGFFKLFLTTEPANLESIEQTNPYLALSRADEILTLAERPEMPKSFWAATCVMIVQSALRA